MTVIFSNKDLDDFYKVVDVSSKINFKSLNQKALNTYHDSANAFMIWVNPNNPKDVVFIMLKIASERSFKTAKAIREAFGLGLTQIKDNSQ